MEQINQILDFIVEIEKLKAVLRQTRPVGLKRYENSAEHSWHVCLSALLLKDFANTDVDIHRVIKMLLIHDLGEIVVGDTIIYSSESKALKQQEAQGVEGLVSTLPTETAKELLALWHEFESGTTDDAKFAKAIDRLPPLLHNINDDGHSWKKHNITKERVFELNGARISEGSEPLWQALEKRLQQAVEDKILI